MTIRVELNEQQSHINIFAEYRYKEVCKALPGASWDVKLKIWRVPVSWGGCLALRSTFKDALEIGPLLDQWAKNELAERVGPANALRVLETYDDPDNEDLFPHQKAGVAYLAAAKQALLADEPGLGKTAQAIRALKKLRDNGEEVFPILITCPNTLKSNWKREFERWWPELDVTIIKGSAT
jgi:SNF2 family DNA or RNA helicase